MSKIENPIFVRGMSRSGGTLMVTLLDAHPEVAMSYELYPNILEVSPPLDLREFAKVLDANSSWKLKSAIPHKLIFTFVARCGRGGLSYQDLARLVRIVADEGLDFSSMSGRMRMIELCGLEKMKRLGKSRWGMKCNSDFEAYQNYWKEPFFLNMLRDGRDVLASQLNTGSFKNSPADVGKAWVNVHMKFDTLVNTAGSHGHVVRYESLAADPEPELRRICDFLKLEFHDSLLHHNEQDLTIFKVSHLSGNRINKKIDTKQIGRWKRDLTDRQLSEFLSVAGGQLSKFGYD